MLKRIGKSKETKTPKKLKLEEEIKIIRFDPFPVNFWIVVTSDTQDAAQAAYSKLQDGKPYERDLGAMHACCVTRAGKGDVYLIFPFGSTLDDIIHECVHGIQHMQDFLDIDNEEFRAYMMGTLAERAFAFVFFESEKRKKRNAEKT